VKAACGLNGRKEPEKDKRCVYCYSSRLEETVKAAARLGFDAFSSSLLYSRFQRHDVIKALGTALAVQYGVRFFYMDFRTGWQEGLTESRAMGLYRQKYCGCIYSKLEREREKKKKAASLLSLPPCGGG
ncbi:MAG: epoxyqueuosine reductase QueH, partial [Deltaproteobacteria bacterium]|nr:epoxyqueuosine reductase QueH [Deltaproteobacteria bacterium]